MRARGPGVHQKVQPGYPLILEKAEMFRKVKMVQMVQRAKTVNSVKMVNCNKIRHAQT